MEITNDMFLAEKWIGSSRYNEKWTKAYEEKLAVCECCEVVSLLLLSFDILFFAAGAL